MARTSTNISLDPELKRSSQELFADLGILHALPKHHVVPGGVQRTALTGETVGFQCFPIHKLGILSQIK